MAKRDSDFAKIVAEAEAAVSGVKDADLRRVAFDKILDRLLSDPDSEQGETDRGKSVARKPATTKSKVAKKETSKAKGPQGYIRELIEEGFFQKPQTISAIKAELGNRGHHFALTSLSTPLQRLCQKRLLRRHKEKGATGTGSFQYSNW
jgi:hypothetical protein